MAPLRMGELFAGYGGLGMGVELAVGDVERVWVSEFDPAPSQILATHWPDVPNLGDVTQIDWSRVEPVDVLTGGFPCQDVSLAGARAGMKAGTRSGLWSYMAAAIEALRPRLVVIENVRGLLSAHAGRMSDADVELCPICVGDDAGDDLRALGAVLGDLADLGFDAEWGLLEAAAVGAPHRRARVFIVAWPADSDRDVFGEHRGESCAEEAGAHGRDGSAHSGGGDRPRLMPTPEAALATRGGASDPARRREGGHSVSLADAVHVLPTPQAHDHVQGKNADQVAAMRKRTGAGVRNLNEVAVNELLPTPKAGDADFGTPRTSGRPPEMSTHLATRLAYRDFGDYQPAIDRWAGVIGRPAPAPTEVGPKGGARLSPLFVEWLMGLPEGHVTNTGITRAAQLKALGNGVVPQQAAAAVTELLRRAA